MLVVGCGAIPLQDKVGRMCTSVLRCLDVQFEFNLAEMMGAPSMGEWTFFVQQGRGLAFIVGRLLRIFQLIRNWGMKMIDNSTAQENLTSLAQQKVPTLL